MIDDELPIMQRLNNSGEDIESVRESITSANFGGGGFKTPGFNPNKQFTFTGGNDDDEATN